ncbi:hypothetical protein VFPPC_17055 [Pochonia chlamydosporia 170]|uniref:Uncharacterized protein n=1 Tax=Pochonia chlamydosporia 170 TaxID=1380566 RepID=A0A179EXU9_METCM|nr:hypothetical protein VFPPC_17055 [Pochonia chlamydosporia 170]OAQ58016.1 hypothetical protein VFPPC_17055 [Pochonia chlamydosporia 170]
MEATRQVKAPKNASTLSTGDFWSPAQSNTLVPNIVGDCASQFRVASTYFRPASVVTSVSAALRTGSLSGLSGSRLVPWRHTRDSTVGINGACIGCPH